MVALSLRDMTSEQHDAGNKAFFGASALVDVIEQAPTPLVILSGPEHRIHLINPLYVRLMRRSSGDSVLGKSIREALPELEGQGFFELLDGVYQTGVPFLGSEVPGSLRCEDTGLLEEAYFDFTYQPIRSPSHDVEGIMVQATDVTERIRTRQEFARREHAIQMQWAELQAIDRRDGTEEAGWSDRQFQATRDAEALRLAASLSSMPASRILSADRIAGSIAVTFDDGKCALYSAVLLKQVFSQAKELF